MKTVFIVYRDRKKEWRWRAKRGSNVVADSGEGYVRKRNALRSLQSLIVSISAELFDIVVQ